MRRIRPATIVSSFCAAVDGGRATIAAPFSAAGDGGFLHTDPKPNVRTPHTDIFGGQSSWVRKQLKDGERARKILFRNYCGRATQELADKEKLVNKRKLSFTQEDFDAFVYNLRIECDADTDYEKYEIVRDIFNEMIQDDDTGGEFGDATQNERVDKLAEIAAEEELNAFTTNSFTTKLMIECEPKYEKRFRELIEKVRKKMIRDYWILMDFKLLTDLMCKCEPEYEKLLCEVLEKVREEITQDDEGENDNKNKIEKLAEFQWKAMEVCAFVTAIFRENLRSVEENKSYFMAYEVIEKVAKKVGYEKARKIAEKKLDALVIGSFLFGTAEVQQNIPYFKVLRLEKKNGRDYGERATQDDKLDEEKVDKTNIPKFPEDELDVFLTNLAIECEMDHEKYEIVCKKFHKVIKKMTQEDELGGATQNDKVDKLAEIAAQEELDAFVTNSFTTNLMIESEPKYEKRFREMIEKVRKKMIQDDEILEAFEFVTDLMSKCKPEYEKLLCQVLEKVREKIPQYDRDEKGGNERRHKMLELAGLDMLAKWDRKAGKIRSFEEELDEFVSETFLGNLEDVEKEKSHFMAYEVIEKVAKKVGNENVRKIAEKELDALVIELFVFETMIVLSEIPTFIHLRLLEECEIMQTRMR